MRPKIRELVVVEGKCDISAVKKAVECDVLETKGFGVFNNKDLQRLIRAAAGERGVVILTDSDRSGFKIRSKLKSMLGGIEVKQAYIPKISGKESRKSVPSADGLLGVEAMDENVIIATLRTAGATFSDCEHSGKKGALTKADLFALGLSGVSNSAQKRAALLKGLDLPESISANAMLDIINIMFTKEEFISYFQQQTEQT